MQGYELYEAMMAAIQEETVRILFHIRVEQKIERESAAKVTGTNKDATPIAQRNVMSRRSIQTIHAHVVPERNINSAADVLNKSYMNELKNLPAWQ